MAAAGKSPATKKAGPRGPKPVAQARLDACEEDILEAIRLGSGYRALAEKYGVSVGWFHWWTKQNPERFDACARAREESADECDEKAEQLLSDATDLFELAKAKELAFHYRWRAKSRNPGQYGEKQQLQHSGEIGLRQLATLMRERATKRKAKT